MAYRRRGLLFHDSLHVKGIDHTLLFWHDPDLPRYQDFLLVMGIGIGWFLHWVAPSIDIGLSILIGIVVTALSLHFYARFTTILGAVSRDVIEIVPDSSFIPPYPPDPIRTSRKSRRS